MDVAAPKIMFLDTYLILYYKLVYNFSVKGNKYYAKIMGFPASNVIRLSSSCTVHYLVAEFGWSSSSPNMLCLLFWVNFLLTLSKVVAKK